MVGRWTWWEKRALGALLPTFPWELLILFLLFFFCICDVLSITPISQMGMKRPRECENRTQATQQ